MAPPVERASPRSLGKAPPGANRGRLPFEASCCFALALVFSCDSFNKHVFLECAKGLRVYKAYVWIEKETRDFSPASHTVLRFLDAQIHICYMS